ncbi:hypothetical protein [Mycobacteroides abscessus]|uniref:hypothetical protein n=1 Tax=Mycobacteroides abscessus TaxID=36809 RepID=UPI002106483D|nr:hypothetical protein [Mycobacteroides abscessus]
MNEQDLDYVRQAAADAVQLCRKYDTAASLQRLEPPERDFLNWQASLAQTFALVAIGEELAMARKEREATRRTQRLGMG